MLYSKCGFREWSGAEKPDVSISDLCGKNTAVEDGVCVSSIGEDDLIAAFKKGMEHVQGNTFCGSNTRWDNKTNTCVTTVDATTGCATSDDILESSPLTMFADEPSATKSWKGFSSSTDACNLKRKYNEKDAYCTCAPTFSPHILSDGTYSCRRDDEDHIVSCPLGYEVKAWKNDYLAGALTSRGFECVNSNESSEEEVVWTPMSDMDPEPKPEKVWNGWSDKGMCDLDGSMNDMYCTCGGRTVPHIGEDGTYSCGPGTDSVKCPVGTTPSAWSGMLFSNGFHCVDTVEDV